MNNLEEIEVLEQAVGDAKKELNEAKKKHQKLVENLRLEQRKFRKSIGAIGRINLKFWEWSYEDIAVTILSLFVFTVFFMIVAINGFQFGIIVILILVWLVVTWWTNLVLHD